MTDQDNSYRPRSPDFSSFAGSPPQHHHQQPVPDPYQQTPYAFPPSLTPQASYDASPFFNPQVPRPSVAYAPQPPLVSSFAEMSPQTRSRTLLQQQQHHSPAPSLPLSLPQQQQPLYGQPQARQSRQPRQPPADHPRPETPPESHPSKLRKTEPSLGPSMGIEVKTKFPVARIKRIMQADEDVGKVAQVTPIAVCKSQSFGGFLPLSTVMNIH